MRADRAILKRQQEEFVHERAVGGVFEQFKVEQKGLWEHKSAAVIRDNRVQAKVNAHRAAQKKNLDERRNKLAALLSAEQKAYDQEIVDREDTPQQRMDKMAVRAYELKKRREDERKSYVQEKLYQQWRDGIDELRSMDSQIVGLKVIASRDQQLHEKQVQRDEEHAHNEFYDELWSEGYRAKIEREGREKMIKAERNDQQTATLGVQLAMKASRVQEDRDQDSMEAAEMKKLWAQQEQEEKDALVREKITNRVERAKADEYMQVAKAQREEEVRQEKDFDKEFVSSVLERERKIAEKEEEERARAKKKAVEYTEALKVEMAKKAASEEEMIKMQNEESEKQWAKRYAGWEKEELARRALMAEVYQDRGEQVRQRQQMRDKLTADNDTERQMILEEIDRLETVEMQREHAEKMIGKRHQEELFRQMDFHQVQRHRQLQQHAIEQRQAAIAEEKIRRAVKAERDNSHNIMREVLERRKAASNACVAPWDK